MCPSGAARQSEVQRRATVKAAGPDGVDGHSPRRRVPGHAKDESPMLCPSVVTLVNQLAPDRFHRIRGKRVETRARGR